MRRIVACLLMCLLTLVIPGCADPKPDAPVLEAMGKSQANLNAGRARAMEATADRSSELNDEWRKQAVDEYGQGMSIDNNDPDAIMQGPD